MVWQIQRKTGLKKVNCIVNAEAGTPNLHPAWLSQAIGGSVRLRPAVRGNRKTPCKTKAFHQNRRALLRTFQGFHRPFY
jgi:hypothetical protein